MIPVEQGYTCENVHFRACPLNLSNAAFITTASLKISKNFVHIDLNSPLCGTSDDRETTAFEFITLWRHFRTGW